MADEKDLDHEYEYDEEGNLKKMRLSREKIFRDRWDGVVEIRFYSKQHVQRISIACKKHWDRRVSIGILTLVDMHVWPISFDTMPKVKRK